MTVDIVVTPKNWLSPSSILYSSRLTQLLVKLTILIGVRPQSGKFADEYWKAMKLEIATLEAIDAWSVID
jgi:hypothetical protein